MMANRKSIGILELSLIFDNWDRPERKRGPLRAALRRVRWCFGEHWLVYRYAPHLPIWRRAFCTCPVFGAMARRWRVSPRRRAVCCL